MNYFSFNSKIYSAESAVIPVDNRALLFGVGLIETMLYNNGIALWVQHYRRLYNSCLLLGIDVKDLNEQSIFNSITTLVEANEIAAVSIIVRLQISVGTDGAIQSLITLRHLPIAYKKPVVGISYNTIKSFDSISHLKTTSRLVYEMALIEAAKMSWDDALLLNQYGHIAETTVANIFWKEEGQLYTPPLTEGCIDGIFRQHLLTTTTNISEAPLSKERLSKATQIYLSNAVRGLYEIELAL